MNKGRQSHPAMPTFRSFAIEVGVWLGLLTAIILTAKEFWQPAEWFVTWTKDELYRAPGLVLIVIVVVLVKNVVVAAQVREREGARFNPIGNRQQRRAAAAEERRKK